MAQTAKHYLLYLRRWDRLISAIALDVELLKLSIQSWSTLMLTQTHVTHQLTKRDRWHTILCGAIAPLLDVHTIKKLKKIQGRGEREKTEKSQYGKEKWWVGLCGQDFYFSNVPLFYLSLTVAWCETSGYAGLSHFILLYSCLSPPLTPFSKRPQHSLIQNRASAALLSSFPSPPLPSPTQLSHLLLVWSMSTPSGSSHTSICRCLNHTCTRPLTQRWEYSLTKSIADTTDT